MTRALQTGQKTPTTAKKDDTDTTVVTKPLSPVTAIAPVLKPAERTGIARQRTPEVGKETKKEVAPGAYTSVKGAVAPLRKAAEAIAFAEFEDFENEDIKLAEEKRKQAIDEGKQEDTSTHREGGVGKAGSVKQTTTVRTGAKRETATLSAEGLAGARAAAKTLLVSNDQELAATLQFLAQAGVFGKTEMKYDVKEGKHALSLSTKASGGAGAQVTGGGAVRIDYLVPAMVAVFETAAKAGAWGQAESGLEYTFSKTLTLKLKSSLEGFAGAMASAQASLTASTTGLGVKAGAKAMAGAKGEAKTTGTIGITDVGELELQAGVMAFAGAEAEAGFGAKIGLSGVAISAKASAFAGAKASVSATGTVKLRGREVLKASTEVGVQAGVGGEAEFTFEFSNGKLTLKGDIGAALGLGFEVGAELEIDFDALAEAILGLIADQWNKQENKIDTKGLDYLREPLKDPEEIKAKQEAGYKAVIDGFDDYASEVLAKLKKQKLTGTEVLEPTRIQAIIQDAAGRLDRRYKETDQGIMLAASDAFGELLGPKGGIVIDALVVRSCKSVAPKDAQKTAENFDTLAKVGKVRAALKKSLLDYANSVRTAKTLEVCSEHKVQPIINNHWKAIQGAYPGAEAKFAVTSVVEETLGSFLGKADDGTVNFAVNDQGKITKFAPKEFMKQLDLTKAERASFAKNLSEQKANAAYAALAAELKQYRDGLVANDKAQFSGAEVKKILGKHTSKIPTDQKKDDVKKQIENVVQTTLSPFVMEIVIGDDFTVQKSAYDLDKVKKAQAEQTKVKRETSHTAEIDKLTTALTGKRDSLVKSGVTPGQFSKQIEAFTAKPVSTCAAKLGNIEAQKDLTKFNAEIEAALNQVLSPLCVMSLATGAPKVTAFSHDDVFKEARDKLAMQIKGGASADNERRALVAKALRDEFGTYGNELRAALQQQAEAKPGGKAPKAPPAGVDKTKLQAIITARTKTIAADIKGKVGDDAVVDAAAMAFGLEGYQGARGPFLLKKLTVENLEIKQFEAAKISELAGARKEKGEQDEAVKTVMPRLTAELQKYVKSLKPGAPLAKDHIQAIIERVAIPGMRTDTKEAFKDVDLVIYSAVMQALGGRIQKLTVHLGFITEFETAPDKNQAALDEALTKLKRELTEYATVCSVSGFNPYKATVQSAIDKYVKTLATLKVAVDDAAVAQLVKDVFGAGYTIDLTKGKITKFEPPKTTPKTTKPKAVKR